MICKYCGQPIKFIDGFYIVLEAPIGGSSTYCWVRSWKLGTKGPYHEPSKNSIIKDIIEDL